MGRMTSRCGQRHRNNMESVHAFSVRSQLSLFFRGRRSLNRDHFELLHGLAASLSYGDCLALLFVGLQKLRVLIMEIDPKYADCIVRRWQQYTGRQAVLEADGRTFDDLARERVGDAL